MYAGIKAEVGDGVILRRIVDLGPGDSFGELALMKDEPRKATVITTEPTWCITLDKQSYKKIV